MCFSNKNKFKREGLTESSSIHWFTHQCHNGWSRSNSVNSPVLSPEWQGTRFLDWITCCFPRCIDWNLEHTHFRSVLEYMLLNGMEMSQTMTERTGPQNWFQTGTFKCKGLTLSLWFPPAKPLLKCYWVQGLPSIGFLNFSWGFISTVLLHKIDILSQLLEHFPGISEGNLELL